ncbi:MAG: hypothetical protein FWG65_11775 [Turicibacter sp.]|nr:hypothetical protein [Turicibacter sp.]
MEFAPTFAVCDFFVGADRIRPQSFMVVGHGGFLTHGRIISAPTFAGGIFFVGANSIRPHFLSFIKEDNMTKAEITATINEIKRQKRQVEKYSELLAAAETKLKAEMERRSVDLLVVDIYKITYKETTQNRIDGKALKLDLPEIAERYSKETKYKRLLIT